MRMAFSIRYLLLEEGDGKNLKFSKNVVKGFLVKSANHSSTLLNYMLKPSRFWILNLSKNFV